MNRRFFCVKKCVVFVLIGPLFIEKRPRFEIKENIMKKAFLTAMTVVLALQCVFALSLDDAVSGALDKSEAVKTALISVRQAENSAKVNTLLPSFSLKADLKDSANLLNGLEELKYPTISLSTGASWTLGSSYFLNGTTTQIALEQSILSWQTQVNSVRSKVEQAYWELATSRRSVEQAEESLRQTEESLEKARAQYEASKASSMTVLQARLNVSDAELTLENAKASYEKAVWEFSDLIGIALDPDTLTLDSFPDVENLAYDRLGDIVDSKVMDTVSVKSAQLSLERTRITVKNTWNTNTIPTVSLSTNLNYKLDKTLFNDSDLNQRLDFSATLSVSIPLDRYIPNTSANIQIKNGELDLEAAEINLSSAISSKKEKALSYRETFSQLLSRRKNLILHQEMAQENLNLVQEAYDHGYASLSELSSARNSLNNANSALLTNSMSFITQLCQLASAIETDFYSLVRYLQ